jgi:hypothetical protein
MMLRQAFSFTLRFGAGIALAIEVARAARLGGSWLALAAALALFAAFAVAMAGVYLYLLFKCDKTNGSS